MNVSEFSILMGYNSEPKRQSWVIRNLTEGIKWESLIVIWQSQPIHWWPISHFSWTTEARFEGWNAPWNSTWEPSFLTFRNISEVSERFRWKAIALINDTPVPNKRKDPNKIDEIALIAECLRLEIPLAVVGRRQRIFPITPRQNEKDSDYSRYSLSLKQKVNDIWQSAIDEMVSRDFSKAITRLVSDWRAPKNILDPLSKDHDAMARQKIEEGFRRKYSEKYPLFPFFGSTTPWLEGTSNQNSEFEREAIRHLLTYQKDKQ